MFVLLSRFTWLLAETIFAWYTFLNGYPLPFCSSILKEKPLQGGKEMTDERIRELIADKKDEELKNMSVEDLEKMLED